VLTAFRPGARRLARCRNGAKRRFAPRKVYTLTRTGKKHLDDETRTGRAVRPYRAGRLKARGNRIVPMGASSPAAPSTLTNREKGRGTGRLPTEVESYSRNSPLTRRVHSGVLSPDEGGARARVDWEGEPAITGKTGVGWENTKDTSFRNALCARRAYAAIRA